MASEAGSSSYVHSLPREAGGASSSTFFLGALSFSPPPSGSSVATAVAASAMGSVASRHSLASTADDGSTPRFYASLYEGSGDFSRISLGRDSVSPREVVKRVAIPSHLKQYRINYICSCLSLCRIHTRRDFLENAQQLMTFIGQNPKIFKVKYGSEERAELLRAAISAYSRINEITLNVSDDDIEFVQSHLEEVEIATVPPMPDDLSRVTQSYDRLGASFDKIATTSSAIDKIMKSEEFVVCPHVVLGAGDTGTTVWLEKYKRHHGKTSESVSEGKLPDVLIIGETQGSWQHDYTLAQPHSLLDRGMSSKYGVSDYVAEVHHTTNPRANARHIYQANIVSLAKTEAPVLLGITVLRIEKKAEHEEDWKSPAHEYRLLIVTSKGPQFIYTSEIDICTGLGPAKNAIAGSKIASDEFERLSQFDAEKKFTPIVDGNQFILSDTEEMSSEPRTIVVYGGGGTAAACYRKGFFGHDKRTEALAFDEVSRRNKVFWISARGFEAAGKGKLATAALEGSARLGESMIGDLQEIRFDHATGKMHLYFALSSRGSAEAGAGSSGGGACGGAGAAVIICDQLVYSLGQEDIHLRRMCQEFNSDVVLDIDVTGMPLSVKTPDDKVHFFGAAAMAMRQSAYSEATWRWLHAENIGPDVGPGSMPPSRAQVKQYMALKGASIESVNANMDNIRLIQEFLLRSGVEAEKNSAFISDILAARKDSASGFSKATLQALLDKYSLNDIIQIHGHCHLIKRV